MTLEEAQQLDIVVAFLLVGTILGALLNYRKFYRWIKPYLQRWFPFMYSTERLEARIDGLTSQVDVMTGAIQQILKELSPNGGSTFRDTLERIENRQIFTDQRFKVILDDEREALFETDEKGLCIWVNRKYLRMVNRSPEEIMGYGWFNTICQEDRERVIEEWSMAIQQNRELDTYYTIVLVPDNVRLRVHAVTKMIRKKDGSPYGYFKILTPAVKA